MLSQSQLQQPSLEALPRGHPCHHTDVQCKNRINMLKKEYMIKKDRVLIPKAISITLGCSSPALMSSSMTLFWQKTLDAGCYEIVVVDLDYIALNWSSIKNSKMIDADITQRRRLLPPKTLNGLETMRKNWKIEKVKRERNKHNLFFVKFNHGWGRFFNTHVTFYLGDKVGDMSSE